MLLFQRVLGVTPLTLNSQSDCLYGGNGSFVFARHV